MISIFILLTWIWFRNHFLIWRHFPLVTRSIRQSKLSAVSIRQKQWQIYLLLGKSIKNDDSNLYFPNKSFKNYLETKFMSTVNYLSCPGKSVNSYFSQYQSYKNNWKFNYHFKNHKKMTAIIFLFTLIPLKGDTNHLLIWCHFPVMTRWIRQPDFFANINLEETMTDLTVDWKFRQKRLQESLFAP